MAEKFIMKDGVKKYLLFNSSELVIFEGTIGEIKEYIGELANKYNYGLVRTWHHRESNSYYADCGPITVHYYYEKPEMTASQALEKIDNTICYNINDRTGFKFGLDRQDCSDCQDFDEFDEAITVLRKFVNLPQNNDK